MIVREKDILLIIDNQKNKMLSVIFEIMDNKLYAYNLFLKDENRKKIQISKINGVEVANFLYDIKAEDLYNIEKMKLYGVDTTDVFVCTFIDEEKNMDFDLLNVDTNDDIFYKKHDINCIIPEELSESLVETPGNHNTMLQYASTNAKALLIMLKNMSVSNSDKSQLTELLHHFMNIDHNYANVANNLDMIFLSTQLLMLDDKLDFVPEHIEYLMQRILIFDFGPNNLHESNNAILTEGELDYKKILKMIRNCIAHSNYKVLEDDIIEFYNEGKNRMNFTINKKELILLFDQLYNYYFLEGTFPIVLKDAWYWDRNQFIEKSLIAYLNDVELLGTNLLTLPKPHSFSQQQKTDENLGMDIYAFNLARDGHKDLILSIFETTLKKYFPSNTILDSKKLNKEDIDYIMSNINEMNFDYFLQLGKTTQIEVINHLIIKQYNKQYYLHSNLQNIIKDKTFKNDSLINQASNYINYKTKIELLIISLLNNLLLFCYNQNKSIIESGIIRFPKQMYNDFLISKERLMYEKSKEASNYRLVYDRLLKSVPSHMIEVEDLEEVEKSIEKVRNKLIKTKNDILNINAIFDNSATDEDYKKINIEILNRIRDCLAHGRICLNISNLNNIMETTLEIKDEYEGNLQFSSCISFGELIKAINQPVFIKSLLNDNQNFKKHTKH